MLGNHEAGIGTKLVDIFNEVDIKLTITWETTSGISYDNNTNGVLDFAEAMSCLAGEREIANLNRMALHIVACDIPPGDVGNVYGINIQYFDNDFDAIQFINDAEMQAAFYNHENIMLDNCGIIIFPTLFDDPDERRGIWINRKNI